MQTVTKTSLLLIGALGLAGCDGPAEQFEFATTFDNFADLQSISDPDDLVNDDGSLVDDTKIAQSADFAGVASGVTSYTGAVSALEENDTTNPDDGRTLIGQLQLDVAFDTNTMVGHAGNFIFSTGDALTGTLTGNGGFVRDAVENPVDSAEFDPHFEGIPLIGALSGPNGEAYDATIGLTGYFLNDGSMVDSIAGEAVFDFGPAGPNFEEGAFAVTD
ncbi:hypothetical protein C7964_102148 [Loktanella sp. PT4BL]|jgi:hypothetical protein|uniref:hypothetical protein n=1 Tax=Loktanella sp. PT4BL TaxID=2135611 RepID=UPI000D76A54D|nr:hypothetical protein [Loktanella sp. PT4BL]PXW70263.1 hypothetical protein C7964_102148 [Loktanella sp. PT4BL]